MGAAAAAAAVASLLMKMIWKIQQKIPKLSESHDEYDRDENGTNGEGKKKIRAVFHQKLPSLRPTIKIEPKVNGCGCYIEAECCKLLPELGSAEVWASSHNSMIIHKVQANRRTEIVAVIGVAGKD
ncbi:hypothetical protein SO802_022567 [Lithocarpus litseifolius]|uniref:Uncharacterized protein n=1 Tax=Lithocarpus litseifolius TaxID=425828 RepID=A0AAW2C6V8_9ROSI